MHKGSFSRVAVMGASLKKRFGGFAQMGAVAAVSMAPAAAMAQVAGGDSTNAMVAGLCRFLGPLVGQNSQVLSLVFLISFGVFGFMWFMNENKEGVMIWVLRTGLILSLLINIFTLPKFFGLPSIC